MDTTFIVDLIEGMFATFICVVSLLLAHHTYHGMQRITTPRLAHRARMGLMVLAFSALIAVVSLVLFSIHPPSSGFAIPFFIALLNVSMFTFQWTSPIPTPSGRAQRFRLFYLWFFGFSMGTLSTWMIFSLLGFLK